MIDIKPCSILCSSRAELEAKLEELEAENQRLRALFLEWSPLHPTESKALLEGE